jgi:hypothetical protein
MEQSWGLLVIKFGKVELACKLIYWIGFYLEEINVRGNKERGARVEKGRGTGGFWQNCILLPPPRFRTEEGGIGSGRSGRRWRLPELPGMAADGVRGKRER